MIAIGDKVKIVNYGHLLWVNKNAHPDYEIFKSSNRHKVYKENDNFVYYDVSPEMVGKEGIIVEESTVHEKTTYSINFGEDGGVVSWFDKDQLELHIPLLKNKRKRNNPIKP